MACSVLNNTQPIWEQFRDAPVYEDIESDQLACDGYMEVTASPEPYSARYEGDDADDELLSVRRTSGCTNACGCDSFACD